MAEVAIQVFVVGGGCGQEEPGIIMRVKLATGNTVVERPVIAHMKARSKLTETALDKVLCPCHDAVMSDLMGQCTYRYYGV